MKEQNGERVTITVQTLEELREFEPWGNEYKQGEKARARLRQRIQLGLPVRISVSKKSLLDRLVGSSRIISNQSTMYDNKGGH